MGYYVKKVPYKNGPGWKLQMLLMARRPKHGPKWALETRLLKLSIGDFNNLIIVAVDAETVTPVSAR